MIPFNFDYYLPDTLNEATDIFKTLQSEGKMPFYYGGGTEIITMARVSNIKPDAVIDIKKIPECCYMGTDSGNIVIGSTVTLNSIRQSNLFPLLSLASGRIADHTTQIKITLGGNLAGTIYYHEAMLPLLLADCFVYVTSPSGDKKVVISDLLSLNKRLAPGELIVYISVNKQFTALPFSHVKKVKSEKIGYPLISLASVLKDGVMSLAVSGLCSYPFRLNDMKIINNQSAETLAQQFLCGVPAPVLEDHAGSAKYREFMFTKTAENIISEFRKQQGSLC